MKRLIIILVFIILFGFFLCSEFVSKLYQSNPPLFTAIVAAIFGTIVSILSTSILSELREIKESKALIIPLLYEFILAFERCALYCKQRSFQLVSFSRIFSFTDSNIFARISIVMKNPEFSSALICLKEYFFQIGLYVEKTTKILVESNLPKYNSQEKQSFSHYANKMQGIAIRMINGNFKTACDAFDTLFSVANDVVESNELKDLSERYANAKKEINKYINS